MKTARVNGRTGVRSGTSHKCLKPKSTSRSEHRGRFRAPSDPKENHVKKLVLAAAAALAAVGAAQALAMSSGPTISNCGKQVTRPKTVVITCADAGYVLRKLKWSLWGATSAS